MIAGVAICESFELTSGRLVKAKVTDLRLSETFKGHTNQFYSLEKCLSGRFGIVNKFKIYVFRICIKVS